MKAGPLFDSVAVPGETTLPTHALRRYPRSAAHRVPVARAQVAEDEDVRLVCTALAKKVDDLEQRIGNVPPVRRTDATQWTRR